MSMVIAAFGMTDGHLFTVELIVGTKDHVKNEIERRVNRTRDEDCYIQLNDLVREWNHELKRKGFGFPNCAVDAREI